MNTENTDNRVHLVGCLFYDAECRLCRSWAKRAKRILARRDFALLPFQSPEAASHLGFLATAPMTEMKLRLADGRIFGGTDALLAISRHIWWAIPLWVVSQLPGVKPGFRAAYVALAANRHCADGSCLIPNRRRLLGWLPMMRIRKDLPPTGAFGARDIRCCRRARASHRRRVFFEIP